MKRIGIATITHTRNNNFNYGNILQNYALTTYLRSQGYKVETIYYQSSVPSYTMTNMVPEDHKSITQFIDDVFRELKRTVKKRALEKKRQHRIDGFNAFINDHIKYTNETYNASSDFSSLNDQYDAFITGSDQVWNPYWEGSNEFYYLPFADRNKRIAYAPSLGIGFIPDVIKDEIGQWLDNFDDISIREEEGKEVLEKYYGKHSTVVCDPVFLLDEAEWSELCLNVSEKDYFAVYILGKKTVETKSTIYRLERQTKKRAVDLFYKDDTNSCFCSPNEFLSYLKNSSFIVTDSFHAVAFSIIFKKPIVLIDRNAANKKSPYKMNGRINNLLKLVGLKDRAAEKIVDGETELFTYPSIQGTELETLISKSKEYLEKRLESIDE